MESGKIFKKQSKVRGLLYIFLIGEIWTGRKVVTNTDSDSQPIKRLAQVVGGCGGGEKAGNVPRKTRFRRTKERTEKRRE